VKTGTQHASRRMCTLTESAGRDFTGAELALDARPLNYATKCSGCGWSGPATVVGALRRSCAVAACRSIANEGSG